MRLMRFADEPVRALPTSPPFESREPLCCAQSKPAYWGCAGTQVWEPQVEAAAFAYRTHTVNSK